jgi:hypothetical protein
MKKWCVVLFAMIAVSAQAEVVVYELKNKKTGDQSIALVFKQVGIKTSADLHFGKDTEAYQQALGSLVELRKSLGCVESGIREISQRVNDQFDGSAHGYHFEPQTVMVYNQIKDGSVIARDLELSQCENRIFMEVGRKMREIAEARDHRAHLNRASNNINANQSQIN